MVEEIDENDLDEGNLQVRPRHQFHAQFQTEIRSNTPGEEFKQDQG